MTEAFSRSAALLGEAAMARLAQDRVLVVGVGGVGSWCAEALVRTGLGAITIMDDDVVAPSNLNRQSPALQITLGEAKVDAMATRLRAINPDCLVTPLNNRYTANSIFDFSNFDLVIDAIDSVADKAELILKVQAAQVPIFSSMGAALRRDPTQVVLTRFDQVQGDGLAKALRQRFRSQGRFPEKFSCVWSKELPSPVQGTVRGSLMPVTATFGMTLAAAAIDELTNKI